MFAVEDVSRTTTERTGSVRESPADYATGGVARHRHPRVASCFHGLLLAVTPLVISHHSMRGGRSQQLARTLCGNFCTARNV